MCVCVGFCGQWLHKPCPELTAHSLGSYWASAQGRVGRRGLLAGQRPLMSTWAPGTPPGPLRSAAVSLAEPHTPLALFRPNADMLGDGNTQCFRRTLIRFVFSSQTSLRCGAWS